MRENGFWKVCAALDCERRLRLLAYLFKVETTEFLSVCELAEKLDTSEPAMSVHLKKLAEAGLVASKRADRRVYYRAFPTTPEGELVIAALRKFFAAHPNENRIRNFLGYAHALSHYRRNAIVRCLSVEPELTVDELAKRTKMPPHTADRLWGDLNRAHIVTLDGRVVMSAREEEAVLLNLTLA